MAGMRMSREMSRSRSRALSAARSMSMSVLLRSLVVVRSGVGAPSPGELDLHHGAGDVGIREVGGGGRRAFRGRYLQGHAALPRAHDPSGHGVALQGREGYQPRDVAAEMVRQRQRTVDAG